MRNEIYIGNGLLGEGNDVDEVCQKRIANRLTLRFY